MSDRVKKVGYSYVMIPNRAGKGAFPGRGGKAQVDLISDDLPGLRRVARRISVTAADAVTAGRGRYGMILWVKQKDYARAARALGAR